MTVRSAKFMVFALLTVGAASACKFDPMSDATSKSLTTREDDAKNANRKKYFFGFREVLEGEMDNETFADDKHIGDIARDANGGGYIVNAQFREGFAEISGGSDGQTLIGEFDRIIAAVQPGDMYLQMSAGHGSAGGAQSGGLGVGLSHQQIKDKAFAILDKGASEVVIFMMACFSGGLVEAFESDPNLAKYKGKTIFIMSSSEVDKESSTGTTEADAKLGRGEGSSGSAFGNSLWRAIRGDADKAGNDDGIVTLQEVIDFVIPATKELGGHTPQFLKGYFDPNLPIKCIAEHPKAAANPLCRVGNAPPPLKSSASGSGSGAASASGSDGNTIFDPRKPGGNRPNPAGGTTSSATVGGTSGGVTTGGTVGGKTGGKTGGGTKGGTGGGTRPSGTTSGGTKPGGTGGSGGSGGSASSASGGASSTGSAASGTTASGGTTADGESTTGPGGPGDGDTTTGGDMGGDPGGPE